MTKSIFDGLHGIIQNLERVLLDVLSASTPWLAPLIPAYLTYYHTQISLNFPAWLALVAGATIEFLGLVTIHTTFQFWDWNESQAERRAPLWISILTGAFYLTVTLTVNVILQWGTMDFFKIVAIALLSTISVPAGIVLALRAQHSRRVAESLDEKAQRVVERERLRQERREDRKEKQARKLAEGDGKSPESSGNVPVSVPARRWDWRQLSESDRQALRGLSTNEIMARFPGMDDRTARNWKAKVRQNGNGHKSEAYGSPMSEVEEQVESGK